MNELEYQQMRDREQAVIDRLNKKLIGDSNQNEDIVYSNLQKQLMIVSKRLNDLELWVLRDVVESAIKELSSKCLVIPKPEMCFTNGKNGHGSFSYVHLDALISSLNDSKINYKIGGQ